MAHEALIREWPTLGQWLAEDRDGLRLHRHLTEAAQEWEALERDPSELYRGPRLAQALEWTADHAGDLNPLEREFVAASRAQVQREAAQHEAQQQRELEAARGLAEAEARRASEQAQAAGRLRARNRVITGMGVLALLAALAAGFFGLQANRNVSLAQAANTQSAQNLSAAQAASTQAIAQRDEAQRQTKQAVANQLAAQAISALPNNLSLALLLGVEADRTASSYLTRSLLHNVLVYSPHFLGYLYNNAGEVNNLRFSPDGTLLATGANDLRLWDIATHQLAHAPFDVLGFSGLLGSTSAGLTFSRDGATLFIGTGLSTTASVGVLNVAAGTIASRPLAGDASANSTSIFAFSPDDKLLATSGRDKLIYLWEVASGQPVGQPLSGHTGLVNNLAFSPDGKTLASSSGDSSVRLWDVATGQPVGAPVTEAIGPLNSLTALSFSPDGKTLAWISTNGPNTEVWLADVSTRPPGAPVRLNGPTVGAISLAFSPDSKTLATGNSDGTLRLWSVASKLTAGAALTGHTAPVTSVVFSPDGKTLASGGADQTVILWQVSTDLSAVTIEDPVTRACRLAGRNLTHEEWNAYLTSQPYRKTCDQWPEGN